MAHGICLAGIAAIGSIDELQSVVGIRAKAFVQSISIVLCGRGVAIVLPVLAYNRRPPPLHDTQSKLKVPSRPLFERGT